MNGTGIGKPSAGKVALVTGASRGLGRAIAVELARRGHHVLLNYRREQGEAERTADAIAALGGSCELRQGDLTRPDELAAVFKGIRRLDLLVNNAGVTRDALLPMMPADSWDAVMATNLTAVYGCSKLAARLMCAARRGCIVQIGSSAAASARVGQANYSAAKSALLGFTRSLARELAPFGVRVVTVAPGFIGTDMAQAVPGSAAAASLTRIPLGRWGVPEDIAHAVAFVGSDAASALSGQTLMVDGGRSAFETELGF